MRRERRQRLTITSNNQSPPSSLILHLPRTLNGIPTSNRVLSLPLPRRQSTFRPNSSNSSRASQITHLATMGQSMLMQGRHLFVSKQKICRSQLQFLGFPPQNLRGKVSKAQSLTRLLLYSRGVLKTSVALSARSVEVYLYIYRERVFLGFAFSPPVLEAAHAWAFIAISRREQIDKKTGWEGRQLCDIQAGPFGIVISVPQLANCSHTTRQKVSGNLSLPALPIQKAPRPGFAGLVRGRRKDGGKERGRCTRNPYLLPLAATAPNKSFCFAGARSRPSSCSRQARSAAVQLSLGLAI